MQENAKKYHLVLICLILASATISVYRQAIHFEFISFDDNWYVYNNNYIKDGLTPESITWAFSFREQVAQTGNWHPLTSLSHILDVELYGLNAGGHHLTNILLHTVNGLLLFLVFQYMTSKPWRSAFVAAVFVLHPLHVESVAWVSERKDVLSMLFWLLTILAYAWYARRPKTGRYIVTLAVFAAGLMAKPMVVTLPFVLLLLDYWPLERIKRRKTEDGEQKTEGAFQRASVRWLIVEKIPFFVFSAAVCVITTIAQKSTWAVATEDNLPLKFRLLNVPISYVKYIWQMFWPEKLTFFYPHRVYDIPLWQSLGSIILLIVITVFFVYFWRARKYLITGWLWYIGTLVPVIGIIQVGRQAMADRYTYIPLTGLFIIISWGVSDLLSLMRYRKIIFFSSAATVLFVLGVISVRQVSYWRDDISLYKRAVEVVPDNWWVYRLLGQTLEQKGQFKEAEHSFKEALRIAPDSIEVMADLGRVFLWEGKLNEVLELYRQIVPEIPDDIDTTAVIPETITSVRPKSGKEKAIIDCYSEANLNFGAALEQQGNLDKAIKYYIESLRVRPDYIPALKYLGNGFSKQGKFDLAIKQYYKLGFVYKQRGDAQKAIEAFSEALELAANNNEEELLMNIINEISVLENR